MRIRGKNSNFYPVILAGGRGTRFWPLSRKKRAKQLLALDGKQTMIQQTVARLLPLAPAKNFWIITNEDLRPAIAEATSETAQGTDTGRAGGRNTAPAIGLAAFLLAARESRCGDRAVSLRSRDRRREAISRDAGAGHRDRGRGREHRGARHPSQLAPKPDMDTSKPAARSRATSLRVRRFTEKPDADQGRGICRGGKLFLEQRHVPVERAHPGRRTARASAQDRAAAGGNRRRVRHTQIRRHFSQALSQVRKHQRRLCRARAALREGRTGVEYFLPARRFRLERPGFVDGAARASHRQEQSAGRQPDCRRRRLRC